MRATNFLEQRAAALVKRSEKPDVHGGMDLAYRVLLSDDWRDWASLVKGMSLGFGFKLSKVEDWFVDGEWTLEERSSWGRRSGTGWPEHARYRRSGEDDNGAVRVVGRGAAYVTAVKGQLEQLKKDGKADAGTETVVALILEGAEANSRVRRERSSRSSKATGRKHGGVELQQEVVLVARSKSGVPLASWRIGLRMFFPVLTDAALDSVLRLSVDVLDYRGQRLESDADLSNQFARSMLKLSADALCELGPRLVSPVWDEDGDSPGDFHFGLSVGLQPGMGGVEAQIHDLLCGLKQDDQMGDDPLMDMHVAMAWIEVGALERSAGDEKREVEAAKLQRLDAARAKEKELEPGDVFKLVEFDVKELCVGQEGLYWYARWMEHQSQLVRDFGLNAQQFLDECGIKADEYLELPFKEREQRAAEAAESWPDEEVSFHDIEVAAAIAGEGNLKPAGGLVVRLLIDVASRAQCVDLVRGRESIAAFLDRCTKARAGEAMDFERPEMWGPARWDELGNGPLTLWQKPKRLLVPKTLSVKHPSIETWCLKHGVEVVRGTSGADSGSTEARLWREDLISAAEPNARFDGREYRRAKKRGYQLEEIRGRLKSICWALNELKQGDGATGSRCTYPASVRRKGADVDVWCAWRQRVATA
jgi:hypothetical protein